MQNKCSVLDCWKEVRSLGYCLSHYQLFRRNGVPERVKQINKGKTCKVKDCDEWAKKSGYCIPHYYRIEKYNNPDGKIKIRDHVLYNLWWQRKNDNVLCNEWLNFDTFVKDVGPKPEGNYILIRTSVEPYGPNNFKWLEHLKRKENETNKEWWARKWQARQLNNPGAERARNFKRSYGITVEEYNEILKKQNFVCAICENEETSFDGKTGAKKKLAVDHCHNTKKVRGLLCWRCNATIGKIEENIKLLDKMKDYLEKYNG